MAKYIELELNQVLIQIYALGSTSDADRVPHDTHSIKNGYTFIPINLELSQPQKQKNDAPKDLMNLGYLYSSLFHYYICMYVSYIVLYSTKNGFTDTVCINI